VVILLGDNLASLRTLPGGSVPCIYLDPPFNTGQRWSGASGSFADVFRWDNQADAGLAELHARGGSVPAALTVLEFVHGRGPWLAYATFMALRRVELARVLTRHGTCWLHLDPPAAGALRLVGDAAFGAANRRGTVVWKRTAGSHNSGRHYARVSDSILVWSGPLAAARRPWTFPELIEDCPAPNSRAAERVGYPTQKPVELLTRVIRWSTRPGMTVLDPFCGSGTTLVAAQRAGRGWIGMDASTDAVDTARQRLGLPAAPREVAA